MITSIGLVQRVGNVATGSGEVREVGNRHEVEVVVEVARVVPARHCEEFWYGAQSIERVTKSCFASAETPSAQR